MSRVKPVQTEEAKDDVKEMYKELEKKIGRVPNIFLNMGNSPAVLKGYLSLSEAASQTSLDPKLREQIALIVGQTNQCRYCLSAHTAIAKGLGLKDQEIIKARQGEAVDAKAQAILQFAKTAVEKRAHISDEEVASLKAAGVTDAEIVEIVLLITLNIFTNYFNHITDTQIDFPVAPELG